VKLFTPPRPPSSLRGGLAGHPYARRTAAGALAVLLAAAGCGYGFSQRYAAAGGVDRIHVRTFENRSADPALGAAVTAALREELSRRGAGAGADAPAWLEGEVRSFEGAPSTPGAQTMHVAIEVRARLVVSGEKRAERTVRRDADQLAGADALETEGRRAVLVRRATCCARSSSAGSAARRAATADAPFDSAPAARALRSGRAGAVASHPAARAAGDVRGYCAAAAGFAAAFASREILRLAAFLWSTPFDWALPMAFSAAWRACFAPAASPLATASRTFFTADFTPVRTWTLRARRFCAWRLRFSADAVFAK
jgi:hypothetical protein